MKKIRIDKDHTIIVDDADFDQVSAHKWYIGRRKDPKTGKIFPTVQRGINKGKHVIEIIGLGRFLMDAPTGKQVIWINGNPLDFRRKNMMIGDGKQKAIHTKKRIGTTSKYKGVSKNAESGRFQARITIDGKTRSLGYFANEVDAAIARDTAAKELLGPLAYLNFPE